MLLASTYAYMTEAAHPPPEDESIIGTCPNISPLIQINFEVWYGKIIIVTFLHNQRRPTVDILKSKVYRGLKNKSFLVRAIIKFGANFIYETFYLDT